MRLSTDIDDPGFTPHTQNVKVFLNGVERTGVITADEEKRLIIVHKRDENGRLMFRSAGMAYGPEFERETLYGDVRIEIGGHGDRP